MQTDFDDEVLGALQSVSDVGRACLLLRIVEQLSYAEIADALQIPQGTAIKPRSSRTRGMRRGPKADIPSASLSGPDNSSMSGQPHDPLRENSSMRTSTVCC